MYGDTYGYRSGLNQSMVRHLHRRVTDATQRVELNAGDLILDIGSNDATTLRAYGDKGYRLIGIDPSATKFREHYPPWVESVADFFTADLIRDRVGRQTAKIITSIAMFYDLEDPTAFMRQIRDVLAEDGIWVFEQSYLPLMVERDAYDTICHEHLSYYALKQIDWMARRTGLKILDVEINDVNGGSFCVTAAREDSRQQSNQWLLDTLTAREERLGYGGGDAYQSFRKRIFNHRDQLVSLVRSLNADGHEVCGYGASTKGNVLLQFCGFTPADISVIAEVNADKFGKFTPGTGIPIASEAAVRARRPDCMMVLPWHFRENILEREQQFLQAGGRLLFPLPAAELVTENAAISRAA
jgi:SAM-dependent methyltransferase